MQPRKARELLSKDVMGLEELALSITDLIVLGNRGDSDSSLFSPALPEGDYLAISQVGIIKSDYNFTIETSITDLGLDFGEFSIRSGEGQSASQSEALDLLYPMVGNLLLTYFSDERSYFNPHLHCNKPFGEQEVSSLQILKDSEERYCFLSFSRELLSSNQNPNKTGFFAGLGLKELLYATWLNSPDGRLPTTPFTAQSPWFSECFSEMKTELEHFQHPDLSQE